MTNQDSLVYVVRDAARAIAADAERPWANPYAGFIDVNEHICRHLRAVVRSNPGQSLTMSIFLTTKEIAKIYAALRASFARSPATKLATVCGRAFMERMDEIALRPEYLTLFRAVVLAAWERRHEEVAESKKVKAATLARIEKKLEQLTEAFVYGKEIDATTHAKMRAKLDEERAFAAVDSVDAEIDLAELEGALAFAEQVISRPARAWAEFSLRQRVRFQNIAFRAGAVWSPSGGLGTAPTSTIFDYLREISSPEVGMVAHTGIEPVFRP